MKIQRLFLVCLLPAGLLLSSCEDFLHKEPLNDNTLDGFYRTEADAVAGLAGAYNDLQDTRYFPHNFITIAEIASGSAWETNTNGPGFKEYETMVVTAQNGSGKNLEMFTKAFGCIGKVNRVLRYIPDLDATEEIRMELEGEVRFLRALNYYHMVGFFGGLPIIREEAVYGGDVDLSRKSVQETWDFIIEDLEYAGTYLPPSRDPANLGRATRGSANGLLARILAMRAAGDPALWPRARDAAQAVIDDGYSLDPDYAMNFQEEGDYNSESLFEIGFDPLSNEKQGNQFNMFNTAAFTGGWSYGEAMSHAYTNFEPEDFIRRRTSVYMVGDSINYSDKIWDGGNQPEYLVPSPEGYLRAGTAKWNDPRVITSWAGSGANMKLLRFAETLLVMAEAENELGNTAEAMGYVKQVRDRVNLTTDLSMSDQDEVRELIFMERMAELCMEGVKYFDLVQRGRGRDYRLKTFNRDEFVVPLPEAEIQKNGWEQNSSLTEAMRQEFLAGIVIDIPR